LNGNGRNWKCRAILYVLLLAFGLCGSLVSAQKEPPTENKYQGFFYHYVDDRSLPERALNLVGLTTRQVGRSFALLAGVSRYKHVPDLPPVEIDIAKLYSYLKEQEFFDEIVILMNDDFTEHNLRYFLQSYFPKRVAAHPKSRFLFAFSGHGMNDRSRGYLLEHTARSFNDKVNSINLRLVRTYIQEVVDRGHHVLALINACYGGNFFRSSFGSERFVPTLPGAHAITAGGANELVYADPDIGPGSVFFEEFFAALDERADSFPAAERAGERSGDGVVTVDELATWLKLDIRQTYGERVNPQAGDLLPQKSLGGFFFLNRRRQREGGVVPPWDPTKIVTFGQQTLPLRATLHQVFHDTLKDGSKGPEMVVIPAGSFMMGSPEGQGRDEEWPQHRVIFDKSFAMGVHEVTDEFRKFVKATRYKTEEDANNTNWRSPGFEQEASHPVVFVSWNDVKRYVEWLKEETGKGYRLPSEAEWEYAARAGSKSSRYWSDRANDACQFANVADRTYKDQFPEETITIHDCRDGYVHTASVGQFRPNDFGLRDMLGNVSEWTADYWTLYESGINVWKWRTFRGGSWGSNPSFARSASRRSAGADPRGPVLGFRLARDL
jgi:formylglycine-generating enzyme required for sulfatase activity